MGTYEFMDYLGIIFLICIEILLFLQMIFYLKKRSIIRKSKYYCTKRFYVKDLSYQYNKRGKNYIDRTFEAYDGTFKEVAIIDEETYFNLKKGQDIGERDIYTLKGQERYFKTFPKGEKPILDGKEELKIIKNIILLMFCLSFIIFQIFINLIV